MKRIKILDIIRSISIFPIVHFHAGEIVFFDNKLLPALLDEPHYSLYAYSSSFAFSGYTIVFLFYYLMGYREKGLGEFKSKAVIFLFGLTILSIVCGIAFDSDFFLEWDIYHFLILSFVFFTLVKNKLQGAPYQVVIWLLLACVPYWKIKYAGFGSEALIGDCTGGTGMWPLFPGLFILFFAYTLGAYNKRCGLNLGRAGAVAISVASICGLGLVSQIYYKFTPMGSDFGCYVHRPPLLIWVLTMMSLGGLFYSSKSLIIREATYLGRVSSSLSRLEWNRNFGLCYLVQWFYMLLLYWNRGFLIERPEFFFLTPFAVIMMTELSVRLGFKLLKD